ncbi:MAG: leucine-rich repeat domain-containing protein [Candidatus Bipolaricaulaceae bacterium]
MRAYGLEPGPEHGITALALKQVLEPRGFLPRASASNLKRCRITSPTGSTSWLRWGFRHSWHLRLCWTLSKGTIRLRAFPHRARRAIALCAAVWRPNTGFAGSGVERARPIVAKELAQLRSLELAGDVGSDTSALADLVRWGVLDLTANQVASLAPLAGLTNLRVLGISRNPAQDLGPLFWLKNLTALSAAQTKIADLSPLAELTNLATLNVQGNRVRSVELLTHLVSSRDLLLGGNQVSDIGALTGLSHLEILELSANPITDIAPLLDRPALRFLNVMGILFLVWGGWRSPLGRAATKEKGELGLTHRLSSLQPGPDKWPELPVEHGLNVSYLHLGAMVLH